MDKVAVEFTNPHDGHEIGARVDLDPDAARHVVSAGVAVPATKPAARALNEDPDTAATAR